VSRGVLVPATVRTLVVARADATAAAGASTLKFTRVSPYLMLPAA
jgi:hypothetical protein